MHSHINIRRQCKKLSYGGPIGYWKRLLWSLSFERKVIKCKISFKYCTDEK